MKGEHQFLHAHHGTHPSTYTINQKDKEKTQSPSLVRFKASLSVEVQALLTLYFHLLSQGAFE